MNPDSQQPTWPEQGAKAPFFEGVDEAVGVLATALGIDAALIAVTPENDTFPASARLANRLDIGMVFGSEAGYTFTKAAGALALHVTEGTDISSVTHAANSRSPERSTTRRVLQDPTDEEIDPTVEVKGSVTSRLDTEGTEPVTRYTVVLEDGTVMPVTRDAYKELQSQRPPDGETSFFAYHNAHPDDIEPEPSRSRSFVFNGETYYVGNKYVNTNAPVIPAIVEFYFQTED